MSNIINIPLNGGYVSTGTNGRDAGDLARGELVTMQSAYYKKNDPNQVWKMPGRALFGSAGASGVKGLAICQFDEGGTDLLLAAVGTTVVSATPGTSGTFSSLITGLNSASTQFTACHQEDRWYLGNGYDSNRVLMPDGTVRLVGMQPPATAPTCAASAQALVVNRPTASTGDFSNGANAYDTFDSTYASASLTRSDLLTVTKVHTWTTFASGTEANRQLTIKFDMEFSGTALCLSDLLIELSQDSGSTWTALWQVGFYGCPTGMQTLTVPVTANGNLLQVRTTITAHGVDPSVPVASFTATAKIREMSTTGGGTANFSTTTGFYYLTTEYNATEDLEGPPQDIETVSELVTMSSQSLVVVTKPATVNSTATHWRLYRTVDGAAKTYENFGLLETIPIASTTYVDTFAIDKDTQLTPIVPLLTVGDLSYPRDTPPPSFLHMMSWQGSICGISRLAPRTWQYSIPGRPESFPAVYVVEQFPVDEHDVLVGQMAVGDTAILLCQGAILAVDELPTVTDGQYTSATVRALKGHPGCVGGYAYTTYSVAGEPRGAWVSPFGVYVTNGSTSACISTDLAWESEVNTAYLSTAVLRWDAKNLILWFEFDLDGDGENDTEMPFHMAQFHDKGGNRPKLGQPTPKATACMTSALIDSVHYRFSGHPSSGDVFVEESGTEDAATGDPVEMIVKTGQIDKDKVDLAVIKATVMHSDFGTGETGTLVATLYRDTANSENSRSQTIRLDGNRGTTIGIGRAGEAIDFQITYDGDGSGALGSIQIEVDGQGRSGSASRWLSSSATP